MSMRGLGSLYLPLLKRFGRRYFFWVDSGCFEGFHAWRFGFFWRGYVDGFEV